MKESYFGDFPIRDGEFLTDGRVKLILVGACFVGLFLLAMGGGLFFFKNSKTSDDIEIIPADETASANQIVVHVDGAVKVPGVYKLPGDSRVAKAVETAGGLTDKADGAKINLAAKVADGQKIHIAEIGEVRGTGVTESGRSFGSAFNQSSLISINDASQSLLESLPGIGPVTAQKIIASRPYSSLDELLSKKAVGKSVFEKIEDLITI